MIQFPDDSVKRTSLRGRIDFGITQMREDPAAWPPEIFAAELKNPEPQQMAAVLFAIGQTKTRRPAVRTARMIVLIERLRTAPLRALLAPGDESAACRTEHQNIRVFIPTFRLE